MPNVLKSVMKKAKGIFAKGGTWKGAQKKAWSEYKSGKKSVVRKKKKTTRRKKRGGSKIRRKKIGSIKSNRDRVDRKHTSITIGSVSHHKSQAKIGLKEQLAKKAGRRELATRKTEKRKLSKAIAKIKKDIRALC